MDESARPSGAPAEGNEIAPEDENLPPSPRSITYKYLSILWILPSFGAIWILVAEARGVVTKPTFLAKLGAISVEQWVALVLLLLHLTFVGLSRHYRQKEKTSEAPGS
jgi:hypothetical protein